MVMLKTIITLLKIFLILIYPKLAAVTITITLAASRAFFLTTIIIAIIIKIIFFKFKTSKTLMRITVIKIKAMVQVGIHLVFI